MNERDETALKMGEEGMIPYPNYADGTALIPLNATKAANIENLKEMNGYSQCILTPSTKSKMRGGLLWKYFITDFRPHTISTWPR